MLGCPQKEEKAMSIGKAILVALGIVILAGMIGGLVGKPEVVWFLVIFETSLWAAIDASKLGTKKYKNPTLCRTGPVWIFLEC